MRRLLLSWLRGEILNYGSLAGVRHQLGFQSLILKGLRLSDYLIKVGRSRCNHLLLELLVTRRVHSFEGIFREDGGAEVIIRYPIPTCVAKLLWYL